MTYFHPKDLMDIYNQISKYRSKDHTEHLTYRLNYFFQGQKDKNKKYKFKHQSETIEIHPKSNQVIKEMLDNRLLQFARISQHYLVKIHEGKLSSLLVHGLGTSHIAETAMTIHPVYGVPYLPAASLKGIVRHWFIHTFFNGDEQKLEKDSDRTDKEEQYYKVYTDIFGNQEFQGVVSFFDVFIPSGSLIPDIMTVHFNKYYQNKGKKPAQDDDELNLINFFSLQTDEPIEFVFSIQKQRQLHSKFTNEELAEIVSDWYGRALSEIGIGSKTSLGYGRFKDWKDVTTEKLSKLHQKILREKEVEKEKAEAEKLKELLSSMSEKEKLIFNIQQLDPNNEQDKQKSKDKIYADVIESKNVEAAKALKEYWIKTKDWVDKPNPKKKQEIKVMELKKMIEN